MRFLPDRDDLRVAIVGFGYVGCCFGAALADRGLRVLGIDSDRSLIDELAAGSCRFREPGLAEMWSRLVGSGRVEVTTDYAGVTDADVVVITVGTPIENSGALLSHQLQDVCRRLSTRLRPDQLVILKSTVPPGTTRRLALPLLESGGRTHGVDFGLAYCPERLAEGSALRQLETLPVIVGGCCAGSSAAAAAFWERALGVDVVPVGTPEAAEMIKLASNWWIDANIAIANELAQVCAVFDVDVLEVIRSTNTLPKGASQVNILQPSIGVGGSCLPKDPWMLWRAARDKGVDLHTIKTARSVNDAMPQYTFEVLRDELAKLGKDITNATVAVLGLSFKNDTGDLRMTPVKPVVDALLAAGAAVRAHDPLVTADDVEAAGFGIAPLATPEEAVDSADCVAVLAGHRQFHELDLTDLAKRVAMPCLFLDGRGYYPPQTIATLRQLGFVFRGIGW